MSISSDRYQYICPCEFGNFWNWSLLGAIVFHKHILFFFSYSSTKSWHRVYYLMGNGFCGRTWPFIKNVFFTLRQRVDKLCNKVMRSTHGSSVKSEHDHVVHYHTIATSISGSMLYRHCAIVITLLYHRVIVIAPSCHRHRTIASSLHQSTPRWCKSELCHHIWIQYTD